MSPSASPRSKLPSNAQASTAHGPRDYGCVGGGRIFTCAAKRQSHDLQERGRKTRDRAFHASKILHPKVLKSILRDAGLSSADLEKLQ